MSRNTNDNCLVYLVRTSEEDINQFRESLQKVSKFLLPYNPVDIVVFHEKSLRDDVGLFQMMMYEFHSLKITPVLQEIEFTLPPFYDQFDIPEYFPHPTHGNGPIAWGHPGFTMGYRHMCRFFSGEIFKHPALMPYEYYMRLDTDSFILKPLKYNVFEFMRKNMKFYSYIQPAVQSDNPRVVFGLKDALKKWYDDNESSCIRNPTSIPEGRMYYTNFEICKLDWFRKSKYLDLHDHLDKTGGYMTNRWGDAPVRFAAINMLMEGHYRYPITGFHYQHGGIYRT